MFKITVKSTVHNRSILRSRGILKHDNDLLQMLVVEIRKTRHFYLYTSNEKDLEYIVKTYQDIGLQIIVDNYDT